MELFETRVDWLSEISRWHKALPVHGLLAIKIHVFGCLPGLLRINSLTKIFSQTTPDWRLVFWISLTNDPFSTFCSTYLCTYLLPIRLKIWILLFFSCVEVLRCIYKYIFSLKLMPNLSYVLFTIYRRLVNFNISGGQFFCGTFYWILNYLQKVIVILIIKKV